MHLRRASLASIFLCTTLLAETHIDPFAVNRNSPKLTTPDWIGEDGVEAVVILSIDDLIDPAPFEKFCRPILQRLKQIDSRAALSIMSCRPDPNHPQLQAWLKEGVSLEAHTFDHPCPLLADGDFAKAKSTYDRCVDLMFAVPGNRPVAFRTPCCDSQNTASPRMFAEIFCKTTANGHTLTIDSSVFNIITPADPDLPRELVLDADGNERFRKYAPFDSYVGTIEDYPYPYAIGEGRWEFPCVTPSDWQAQHLHGVNNPKTVEDWKAALDATVIKRGVFTLVFHPHGWIKSEQIVELIDHAVAKHGKKVKFLTFAEANDRLTRKFPREKRAAPPDDGKRLIDIDNDSDLDAIQSDEKGYLLELWDVPGKSWRRVITGKRGDGNPREIPMIARNGTNNGAWFHSRHLWVANEDTATLPNRVDRRSFAELLADVEPQALSPEASLRAIAPRAGFKVELMAAEPLVQDPIAFVWGADGKFWVVEMGTYPSGANAGRVKFLEDTDGDGKYDKATLFLDGLSYPTSVLPWRDGVLIACAPDIFFARDTDGDGHPDVREVLFTGFKEGNPQHRVNSLTYGLDNWIYGANGDAGGTIKSIKTGETFDISGRDFRFNPDTGAFDPQSGQSQFGRNRDDFGNYFGCNNADPMYHFVLADHYLRRNPHVAPRAESRVRVSQTPGAAPVFPISRTLPRFNDPANANHFTSACSAIVYRNDLFGPHFANNVFISEPVHNLIHREIMSPAGCTFTSKRAGDEQKSEFLASADNWFRPTTIQTGPDGTLWIADMYRAVIEHPEWIPADWQKKLDLHAGSDKGRVYRVYPIDKSPRAIPRLDRMTTEQLVAALDSPNGWQRDTAQRLLIERHDKSAAALLAELFIASDRPVTRLHALCTLEGIERLGPRQLDDAVHDPDPAVRRHAIRMCEPLLASSPNLADALLKLIADPDPQVRLQLAFTLGEWKDARAGEALAEILAANKDDRFITAAAISSINKTNLPALAQRVAVSPPSTSVFIDVLKTSLAVGEASEILLHALTTPKDGHYAPWQFEALAAAAPSDSPAVRAMIRAACGVANHDAEPVELRVSAISIIDDDELLRKLLTPTSPPQIQQAAIQRLSVRDAASGATTLISAWNTLAPPLRSQALDALLSREPWTNALLDAIEKKRIAPIELDAVHRQRLLQNEPFKERETRLLAETIKPDRQKVLDTFKPAAALSGDMSHGRVIFTKICATCHQLGDLGKAVGPDLASLGNKSADALLVATIDPNRAVESKFLNYVATLKDGQMLTGLLSAETGTSITLLGSDAKPQQILRSNLKSLRSQGISLMPESLETGLTPQDMADLFAFVRGAKTAN